MTQKELTEKINAFEPWIVVEWRSGEARRVSGKGSDGTPFVHAVVVHRVEIDGKPLTVKERLPEGTRPENYTVPWKRGERVAMHLLFMEADKGAFYVRVEPSKLVA